MAKSDLEKAAELVDSLAELADKIDPATLELVVYLAIGGLVFLTIKAIFTFLSDRDDKKLIRENSKALGRVDRVFERVEDALNLVASEIKGCGLRGNRDP